MHLANKNHTRMKILAKDKRSSLFAGGSMSKKKFYSIDDWLPKNWSKLVKQVQLGLKKFEIL
jgi:hypothetical protein